MMMILFAAVILMKGYAGHICSRAHSKVIQKIVEEELIPIYERNDYVMPKHCPINQERNMYIIQERNKLQISYTKWTCTMCGKSFYEERYIDKHFDLKHNEYILQGNQVICMQDFCDIFRCDVFLKIDIPSAWKTMLCKEDKLADLKSKCHNVLSSCLPMNLTAHDKDDFFNKLEEVFCSFLSCNTFWDIPNSQDFSYEFTIKIIAFVFLTLILLIYYTLFCSHYFSDQSLLTQIIDDERDTSYEYSHIPYVDSYSTVRQRYRRRDSS